MQIYNLKISLEEKANGKKKDLWGEKKKEKKLIAEDGFDPSTSGLWAQHAPTAPLCWVEAIVLISAICIGGNSTYAGYLLKSAIIDKPSPLTFDSAKYKHMHYFYPMCFILC